MDNFHVRNFANTKLMPDLYLQASSTKKIPRSTNFSLFICTLYNAGNNEHPWEICEGTKIYEMLHRSFFNRKYPCF